MPLRAAVTAVTLLLIASSPGCGTDSSREGPPFQPGNIESPRSLLITNSDVEGVGPSSPYGVVLRWWQALQQGDVERVRRSYIAPISSADARHEIDGLRPRFSQPIDPEVKVRGALAFVEATVRTASPFAHTPGVVSVRDFPVHFRLLPTKAGWKLRADSYKRYINGRKFSLAVH